MNWRRMDGLQEDGQEEEEEGVDGPALRCLFVCCCYTILLSKLSYGDLCGGITPLQQRFDLLCNLAYRRAP
ncbi:hypothetical protein ACOMHN_023191 [Nucella lapillus]